MAALTTAQEYVAVREALQALTGTSSNTVSVTVDGMSIEYLRSQMTELQDREKELAARLAMKNSRKRTVPDFSYS